MSPGNQGSSASWPTIPDDMAFHPDLFVMLSRICFRVNSRMVLECLAKILETGQIPGELAVAPDPGAAAVLKLFAGGRERSGNEAGRAEHLLSALDGSGAGNTVMPQMVAGIPAEQLAEDGHFISRCFSLGALTVTGTDLGRPVLGIPNQNVRCQLRDLLGLGEKAA